MRHTTPPFVLVLALLISTTSPATQAAGPTACHLRGCIAKPVSQVSYTGERCEGPIGPFDTEVEAARQTAQRSYKHDTTDVYGTRRISTPLKWYPDGNWLDDAHPGEVGCGGSDHYPRHDPANGDYTTARQYLAEIHLTILGKSTVQIDNKDGFTVIRHTTYACPENYMEAPAKPTYCVPAPAKPHAPHPHPSPAL
jgi:hypothetical protein